MQRCPGRVPRRPDRLQRPAVELVHVAILELHVRLDVSPGGRPAHGRPRGRRGRHRGARRSGPGHRRRSRRERALPMRLVDLGLRHAVLDEPAVGEAGPRVVVEPAVDDPLPLALEHDDLAVGRLLLDPARHAVVIGMGVGDHDAPDVARLVAQELELGRHRRRRLGRAEAGIEERDAVAAFEDVREHVRQRGRRHRRLHLVQAGHDLQRRGPFVAASRSAQASKRPRAHLRAAPSRTLPDEPRPPSALDAANRPAGRFAMSLQRTTS